MRQGNTPENACKLAVERIIKRNGSKAKDFQVAFIAINKKGEYGASCIQKGFNYAVCYSDSGSQLIDCKNIL